MVGDVSGKGLEVSALTSVVKDSIKAYSQLGEPPGFIMNKTNNVVVKVSDSHTFVTVFFGILDTRSGDLVYCNAGHQPGIIKTGAKIRVLEPTSMLLGAIDQMYFVETKVRMGSGDILVLYTDGVTEARHRGELFGERRLRELIRSTRTKDVKKVPRLIFTAIDKHSKGKLSDDAVVLAVSLR